MRPPIVPVASTEARQPTHALDTSASRPEQAGTTPSQRSTPSADGVTRTTPTNAVARDLPATTSSTANTPRPADTTPPTVRPPAIRPDTAGRSDDHGSGLGPSGPAALVVPGATAPASAGDVVRRSTPAEPTSGPAPAPATSVRPASSDLAGGVGVTPSATAGLVPRPPSNWAAGPGPGTRGPDGISDVGASGRGTTPAVGEAAPARAIDGRLGRAGLPRAVATVPTATRSAAHPIDAAAAVLAAAAVASVARPAIRRRATEPATSPGAVWQEHGRRWQWRLPSEPSAASTDPLMAAATVRPPAATVPRPAGRHEPVAGHGGDGALADVTDLTLRRRVDRLPSRGRPAGPPVHAERPGTVRRLPTSSAAAGADTATTIDGLGASRDATVRPPSTPAARGVQRAPASARTTTATGSDTSGTPEPPTHRPARPPAGRDPVGAVARSLAATFAAELALHRVERPRPIPMTFRPLATAIVGDRPVHVATGTASRRALAAVGKRAATTGDTIHLATTAPTAEVMAHELTHIAHPSPVARFFDDDDHSPEERRAEQVASIMRRSPVVPRVSAAAGATVQRTSSRSSGAAAAAGTVSAAALAGQLTGTGSGARATSPRGGDVIQRVIGGHRRQTAPPQMTAAPQVGLDAPQNAPFSQPAATIDDPHSTAALIPDLSTQFDRILELLEDRILRELERRGGRFRGGF